MTSSSKSNYHLFTLFIVLLVLINNHQISANSFSSKSNSRQHSSIYNDLSSEDSDENESPIFIRTDNVYAPDHEEIISRNPWSQLFHRQRQQATFSPTYYTVPSSIFNLRRGEIRYIPYLVQKRAIPIEFQKALFAHGIVGRRR